MGPTSFLIERPFTISVTVVNAESRPTITFPDIPGLLKRGVTTSVTSAESDGKTVVSQIITQTYQARAPGRYLLAPFSITVDDQSARSPGATLTVRGAATPTGPASLTMLPPAPPEGLAFLDVSASKTAIYAGEGVALSLSFFVADTYPYVLNFTALDRQLQAITNKIRPVNAWEENRNITELKPVPVRIGNRNFRQYKLFQAVFFPLSVRPIRIPPVTLRLVRPRPLIGPPSAQPEYVSFTSKPVSVAVRALPPHPQRGRLPVGQFRLDERVDRRVVGLGQSVRYTFTVVGEGNIATLPAPALSTASTDADIFPPDEQLTINRQEQQITGQKSFTYYIVPHQNGPLSLVNRFQWVYFDPQLARYDTLRPGLTLRVGGGNDPSVFTGVGSATVDAITSGTATGAAGAGSIYAGIDTQDSGIQPIRIPDLIQVVATALIVIMLLGMIFILFRK
ncbi:BatD family protein [Spirosoma luteolum]